MKRKFLFILITLVLIVSSMRGVGFSVEAKEQDQDYDFTIDDTIDRTGEKDASRALSKLIEEASKAGTPENPSVIYIPEGKYLIEDCRTIFIASNVVLHLDDKAEIQMQKYRTKNDPMMISRENLEVGGYDQLCNVEIYGGTWNQQADEDRNYYPDGSIINSTVMGFLHAQNIYIHDTLITNSHGRHVLSFDGCKNVRIENVTFKNCYPVDYPDKINTMETIHLDICDEVGGESYPYDDTPCQDVVVNNCTFENVCGGVGPHHTDQTRNVRHSNIKVTNNTFINLRSVCVDAAVVTDMLVSGNTLINGAKHFMSSASGENIIVEDNYVDGAMGGVYIGYGPYGIGDYTIRNNTFKNLTMEAVFAEVEEEHKGAADHKGTITVEGNDFEKVGNFGIFIDRFDSVIRENNIKDIKELEGASVAEKKNMALIRVGNASSSVIENNIVSGSVRGIAAYNMGQASICGNDISGITGIGIAADGEGHTISENKVDGGSYSIFLTYAPTSQKKTVISKNDVANADFCGISAFVEDKMVDTAKAKNAQVEIADNTVVNVNNIGIHSRGYNTSITGNYVKDVGYNAAEAGVAKNDVTGIRVNGVPSSGKVAGNTVVNTTVGLGVFHSKNVTISENAIKYASRYGIQVGSSDSSNFVVDSNTAIESGSTGSGAPDDSAAFRATDLTDLSCSNNILYGNGVYDIAIWNVKGEVVCDQNQLNGDQATRLAKNVDTKGTNIKASVKKFAPGTIELEIGEKLLLLTDKEDASHVASWTSTDLRVASVNQGGVLEGLSEGECIITLKVGTQETKATVKVLGEKKNYDVAVTYTTHVQRIGWQPYVKDGVMAGTSGKSLRLEAIRIKLETEMDLGIEYTTHVQNYGWLPWVQNGEDSGTSGESKRLEAIEIRLTGKDADLYDVYYRVHAQRMGWMGWAKNGEASGTAGYSYRLEGIQIVVQLKTKPAPVKVEGISSWSKYSYSTRSNGVEQNLNGKVVYTTGNPKTIQYSTHVQGIGWQSYKFNGQMSGTKGQSKRLEGIKISLCDPKYSGSIEYRTYVQGIGWMDWKKDGEMSGTSGRSLRLEAINVRLTDEMAEKYDVYYRVQAQTYGWLGWTKNGEDAGTVGPSKRLEAIQIVLVKKGGAAPAVNWGGYASTTKDSCKYQ